MESPVADVIRLRSPFETVETGTKLHVSRQEIPWLKSDHEDIDLKKVRLQSGVEFYLASMIRGKSLVAAAGKLDEHRSKIANNLFYTTLSEFIINNYNPHVKVLSSAVTENPIYYASNPGGQRVYFMRFGRKNNLPVIVRIAACDKSQQVDVLSVLTTSKKQWIKNIGA